MALPPLPPDALERIATTLQLLETGDRQALLDHLLANWPKEDLLDEPPLAATRPD